jgi:hypothetical protein
MPRHAWATEDQTCVGQQQWPFVSSLTSWPAGQLIVQVSPLASMPVGHCGTPRHVFADFAHTCDGQQQWPAVSAETT